MSGQPPPQQHFYELYRRSSIGSALTDALDLYITEDRIDPQIAIKMLQHFDRIVSEVLNERVKARMSFKGHLDTYRFCDEVWTFIIKDINFKLDNNNMLHSDRIKIVAMNSKKPGET
ncbi:transcription initiation factor 2A gamma chain [Trichodelitschia bisporula]|uniref:Transcription initiation factor IIA subunit 2 n=1 Tax=Trichodelitschia bisporula TaxID=703511 RepID=A0A6G1HKV6_9PEZI|nr:transcription initiation factor 2A gamma chain [Trichodelitschia bisporula]